MDKGTTIRIIVFILAWVNQLLVSKGMHPLPVLDESFIAIAITFFVSVWALFKNNYLTSKGKAQKQALERQNLK
jgi:SPP1 family holin